MSLRIQYECGNIRTRKTPNADTFHAVAVGNLNIKDIMNNPEVNGTFPHNPVDISILKYRDQPSIKLIRENVSFVNPLILVETDIEKEILKLNPEKGGTLEGSIAF